MAVKVRRADVFSRQNHERHGTFYPKIRPLIHRSIQIAYSNRIIYISWHFNKPSIRRQVARV